MAIILYDVVLPKLAGVQICYNHIAGLGVQICYNHIAGLGLANPNPICILFLLLPRN